MIRQADFVIIAVPTPVTKAKDPDMEPVESVIGMFRRRRDAIFDS